MPRRPTPPISRRDRPAKPALTYEGIVATAVRLMRAEGLQRVTMRRLAQELDTGAASLYVYVANTAELHAAILEDLLGAVDLAPTEAQAQAKSDGEGKAQANGDREGKAQVKGEGKAQAKGEGEGEGEAQVKGEGEAQGVGEGEAEGDWQDRLVALLGSYTKVLFEHSALAAAALVARPSGPNYLALLEAILALLHEGGMPDGQAALAVDVLLQVATATATEHSVRAENESAAEEEFALMEAVRGADDAAHPRLAAVGEKLFDGPAEDRLSWTFHAVINGALATPRGPAR